MYDFDRKKFDKMLLMIDMNQFLGSLSLEVLEKIIEIAYGKYHYRQDYYYDHPDAFCNVLREVCGISYVKLIESMCATTFQDV